LMVDMQSKVHGDDIVVPPDHYAAMETIAA
jgi:hypothetical protein